MTDILWPIVLLLTGVNIALVMQTRQLHAQVKNALDTAYRWRDVSYQWQDASERWADNSNRWERLYNEAAGGITDGTIQ